MGYKFDGKDATLFAGGDELYAIDEISVNIESDRLEGTSRASGSFEAAISGDYTGTATASTMFTDTTVTNKLNGIQLLTGLLAGTKYTLQFRRADATNANLNKYITVDAFISDATFTFNRNEVVPTSITFQFTGSIDIETEAS